MNQLLAKPKLRAMTSDEVLGLFHQWAMIEYWLPLDEVKDRLGRDISIHKLLTEVDYLGNWKKFSETLNIVFDIDLSQSQWKPCLQWPRHRNVGDLCDFISQHAVMEQIEPAEILGRSCIEAGVFRSIVSMLKRAGADTSDLAPSTRVGPYILKYNKIFFMDLGKIAPGAVPKFEGMVFESRENSIFDVLPLLFVSLPIVVSLSVLLSAIWPLFLAVAGGAMSIFVVVLLVGTIWNWLKDDNSSEIHDRRTFKQLCCVVADTIRAATASAHDDHLREAPNGIGTCFRG